MERSVAPPICPVDLILGHTPIAGIVAALAYCRLGVLLEALGLLLRNVIADRRRERLAGDLLPGLLQSGQAKLARELG
jgi:hypothetical protein